MQQTLSISLAKPKVLFVLGSTGSGKTKLAVEIALAIEDAFNIVVPDNQAGKLVTVGQLVDFIESHKG